jgi:hypothetical protein
LIVATIMRRGTMPGQGGRFATLVCQPVPGLAADQSRVISATFVQAEINVIG